MTYHYDPNYHRRNDPQHAAGAIWALLLFAFLVFFVAALTHAY
jgi:hypothetical protein